MSETLVLIKRAPQRSWMLRRVMAVAGAIVAMSIGIAGSGPASSSDTRPRIRVPAQIAVRAAGDIAFTILFDHKDAVPAGSVVQILSPLTPVAFSAGRDVDGVWVIPLDALGNLRLKVPAGSTGKANLFIMLVDNGTVLSSGLTELTVMTSLPAPAAAAPGQQASPVAKPPTLPQPPAADSRTAGPASAPTREAKANPPETQNAGTGTPSGPPTIAQPPPVSREAAAPAKSAPPAGKEAATMAPVTPKPPTGGEAAVTQPVAPSSATAPSPAASTATEAPAAVAPPVREPAPAAAPQQLAAAKSDVTQSPAAESAATAATRSSGPGSASLDQIERMLEQGRRQLELGNIAVARQYFLRAAELGSAAGALSLAATHDPRELASMPQVSIKADPTEARRWYERAAALGAPQASERLLRLGAR
jgi:hypothetical protein